MSLTIIFVLALHLIADFLLQPNWIQTYKSQDNSVLLMHVTVYFTVFVAGLLFIAPWLGALLYSFVNAALHFGVDYCSSRIITAEVSDLQLEETDTDLAKPLYQRVNLYKPSLFLGVDQLLHQACLISTISILSISL
tara:strand:- start:683 stop:1093 length:411 start_codon:yes stop_codon:yes gene_type:complete